MNKILNIVISLCIVLFASCQTEELQPTPATAVSLEIVTSTEHTTRTSLHENGKSVVWTNGDAIAVYDLLSDKRQFTAQVDAGTTRFKGFITPKNSIFCAVYPYDLAANTTQSLSALSMTLPSEQTAVKDGFASGLNLSIAKGQRNIDGSPSQVQFRNVCQLFKVQIPSYIDNRIARIVLSAQQDIAGPLTVNHSSETPVVSVAEQGGAKSVTLLPPSADNAFAQGTYYFVLAPVQINGFTLTLTDVNGKTYSQHSSSTIGGQRGMIYTLGNLDLIEVPSVTSTHVYSSGVLQGTDVTLTPPVSDKAWSATIKNAQGTIVRTIASATGTLKSEHTDSNWPYLPKGAYTVNYTFTTANGKQMQGSTNFNVTENPTFGVSQAAASSYTYYVGDGVEKNVNRANATDAFTVTDIHTSVTGISAKILDNSNYAVSYTNDFGGSVTSSSNSKASYANIKYNAMGSYTLAATATFDGETKTGSKTVHITGLPYTAKPPTDAEWDGSVNNWNYTNYNHLGVRLHNHTISKTFNVPANTDINVYHDVDIHTCTAGTTYTLSAGGENIFRKEESGRAAGNECHNHSGNIPGRFTPSNATISVDNSYGNPGSSGLFYGTHLLVREITVRYR